MNAADCLLHWLSERGRATPAHLRRACEGLRVRFEPATMRGGLERHHWWKSRLVSRLRESGHTEHLRDGTCIVVPATIVLVGESEGHWYGRRTPELRRTLESHRITIDVVPQNSAPELWRLRAPKPNIASVARQYGFVVEPERGYDLLRALPQLRAAVETAAAVEPPVADHWEFFDVDSYGTPSWTKCTAVFSPGLYRDIVKRPAIYIWRCEGGQCLRLSDDIQKAAARWEITVRRTVPLLYDSEKQLLTVKTRVALPLLIERALVTASGLSPRSLRGGHRVYSRIEGQRAHEVARLLDVRLLHTMDEVT